jgi:PAS domain S-box-containing protein
VTVNYAQLIRYCVAGGAVGLALVLMLLLDPWLAMSRSPFLLFFGAIIIGAWYGGTGPGLLATLLSAIASDYFFLTPGEILSSSPNWQELSREGLFLLEGGFISKLCGAWRQANQRLQKNLVQQQQNEIMIAALNQDLQRRVNELQTLFDVTPIHIAIAEDAQSQRVRINPAFTTLLNLPPSSNSGEAILEDVSQLQFKVCRNGKELTLDEYPLRYAAAHGVALREIELELISPDGISRILYGHAVPLFDEQGQPRGAVSAFLDVTERKATETALMRANERFELATAAVRGVLYDWNPKTLKLERTRGLVDLLGYRPEEAEPTLEWWNERVHPADRERLQQVAQQALIDGDGFTVEYRVQHRDGSYRHVWDRALVERDAQGQVTRVVGWSIDVTDRARAETALAQLLTREQEIRANAEVIRRQLADIFETSPIGIGFLDQEQRFVAINKSLAEINGLTREQHLNCSIPELFSKTDPELVEIFHQLYRTGEAFISPSLPVNVPGRSDRRPGYYNVYYLPRLSAEQIVESVLVYVVDVTEQFRLEQAQRFLAESSKVLASSLDYETTLTSIAEFVVPNLADWCAVHVVDEAGVTHQLAVTHVNTKQIVWAKQLQAQYPYDPTAAMGVAQVIRSGQPELYSEISDSLLAQFAHDQEHLKLLKDVGFSSVMIVPMRLYDRTLGTISFIAAESGRRYDKIDLNLAEELGRRAALAIDHAWLYATAQQNRVKAEAANRTKDEFLAVLSHELRSPLNPILGWAKLLNTRKLDEATTTRALETIERNAKLQTQLIEDLLDVSRILQGKLSLSIQPVDPITLIEAALETVRLSAIAKSIQIVTSLMPVGHVWGDPNRLQQVIWNLLSNAIKFTPTRGRVEVKLEGIRDGEDAESLNGSYTYAMITVRDTGKGISPNFLPHVFDYFRQADSTTTRRFGGLGLGLAIVRHIVELHGGTVQAESLGEDQGATFTVCLPLKSEETMQICDEVAVPPASVVKRMLDGIRVLVVDDEADNREFITYTLEQQGADVTAVGSAKETLIRLAQSTPDILISDIGMPEVDGYRLIQQVRAMSSESLRSLSAIALTAYAGDGDRQQALAAGFQAHLAKPVDPAQLVGAILELVKPAS